jgi:PST family polysaccharide transporter
LTSPKPAKWLTLLPPSIRDRIKGRHNLQKILGNTGWLFFDKILRMGVGLFVGVWVARYLGPSRFGAFNFAIAFAALFGAIASLGLDGIVIRDIVHEAERKYEILSSAFLLKLCGGALSFLISLVAILLLRPQEPETRWLVGIIAAGMIFQSFDAIDLWFQSQVQSKYTVVAKNFAFIVMALVKVVLILEKAPLTAFAWSALGEILIGSAGLIFFYYRQISGVSFWHPTVECAQKLLKNSWPLIFSGMVIAIYMKIDQIMLGEMINNQAVGLYSAAVRISEVWYFIPGAIVSSMYPAIVKAKKSNQLLYLAQLQRLYSLLIWLALSLAIPLTFLSSPLLVALFGAKYAAAGPILSVHIWTSVFVFYGIGKSIFVQCENMQLFSLVCTASGAVVNIVLNLFFIEKYTGMGAAVATLCAQIISAIILPSLYRKDRINVKFFFKAFVTKPGLVNTYV